MVFFIASAKNTFEIFYVGFCPVHCGPEEVHCPGPWEDGKQTAADFCLPKDGKDLIYSHESFMI